MDVTKLLTQVKNNEISIEQAEAELKNLPYEDLGFAKLDHHRKVRQGFEEVVYCQGKATPHLVKIYQTLTAEGIDVLGTRASREQYEAVKEAIPEAVWDEVSRVLKVEKRDRKRIGRIVVCTGGTADVPVAEEAAQVAEFFGTNVTRLYDVGVAGIHRLLSNMEGLPGRQLRHCGSRDGGRAGRSGGGSGGCAGHRSADFRGIWRELRRPVGPFNHAEFLRQRHYHGKYRQWLRGGLCGDPDQPAGLRWQTSQ